MYVCVCGCVCVCACSCEYLCVYVHACACVHLLSHPLHLTQLCCLSLDEGSDSSVVDGCRKALYNGHQNRHVTCDLQLRSLPPTVAPQTPAPPPLNQMLRHLHQSRRERNGRGQRELGARLGRRPHYDARHAAADVVCTVYLCPHPLTQQINSLALHPPSTPARGG